MSRIHDALSRVAGDRTSASADLFVSAWPEGRAAGAPRPTAAPPAPRGAAPPPRPVEPNPDLPLHARRPAEPSRADLPVPAAPVLSPMLPERFGPDWRERLTVWPEVDGALIEQFRRVAATLIHRQRAERIKSVMVASANPGDGKTLTALNLALVLSESYRDRVLLVDGDLRRPTIAAAASVAVAEGLIDVVKASEDRRVSLVPLTDTLTLLPAGAPDADPLSGLTSERMQDLLEQAAERFDWVIVDSPPIGATADASLLCAMVDTVILVIRAGETPHTAVQQAIDVLGRARIHGVVLNAVDQQVVRAAGAEYQPYAAR